MNVSLYKVVPIALAACLVIAILVALANLVAAIVGWRGPYRRRRLWRFAIGLAAYPVLATANYAYVQWVYLPTTARESELRSTERSAAASFVHARDPAPHFVITDSDGHELRMDGRGGKVVMVSFFATWCGPCIDELPQIQAIWDEHSGNPDFALLVIGREETGDAVVEFREDHGFTFPIAADPDRSVYSLFAEELIPRTYLIGRDGTICFTATGNVDTELDALAHEVRRQLEMPQ